MTRMVTRFLLAATAIIAPHAGARAQLYVAAAQLHPAAQGWAVAVDLRDLDSGQPEPGFAVQVKGTGPGSDSFEPQSLSDTRNDGHYEGAVPVTKGHWQLTVEAAEVPGGNPALPVTRTWDATVRPGEALNLAGSRLTPPAPASRGGTEKAALAVAGATALAGIGGLWLGRHRRTVSRGSSRPLSSG